MTQTATVCGHSLVVQVLAYLSNIKGKKVWCWKLKSHTDGKSKGVLFNLSFKSAEVWLLVVVIWNESRTQRGLKCAQWPGKFYYRPLPLLERGSGRYTVKEQCSQRRTAPTTLTCESIHTFSWNRQTLPNPQLSRYPQLLFLPADFCFSWVNLCAAVSVSPQLFPSINVTRTSCTPLEKRTLSYSRSMLSFYGWIFMFPIECCYNLEFMPYIARRGLIGWVSAAKKLASRADKEAADSFKTMHIKED